MNIHYTIDSAELEKIIEHLTNCDPYFVPPLTSKVSIMDYSTKIVSNAVRFEAWDNQRLAGLVAAYLNEEKKESAFITNVSVLIEYGGKGIAKKLMELCSSKARDLGFKYMMLEVSSSNVTAQYLYKRLGFEAEKTNKQIMLKYL